MINTVHAFDSLGSEVGQFHLPRGVALDRQGRIVVADQARIQICDVQGNCSAFGSGGSWGVAVDSQDQIIVADSLNNRIQICDAQGNCFAFGSSGSGLGQFSSPSDAAINSRGQIVVADRNNDRIQLCDAQGNSCTAFGSEGSAVGQFEAPFSVAIDSQDQIIVADQVNGFRIQVCDGIDNNCDGDVDEGGVCDADGDGVVDDVCDPDDDNDGVNDDVDLCPFEDATGSDADLDGCIDTAGGLMDLIETLPPDALAEELKNSLETKVTSAEKQATKDNLCAAINKLEALQYEVDAQRGKKITDETATLLVNYANHLITQYIDALPEGETCF